MVVTGGAGFVGSHLCDRFIREGRRVVSVDNLLTGSERNLRHLINHPAFTFLQADVNEPFDVEGPVALVLHFASPASPKDYVAYPLQTLKVGAWGTSHALELARAKSAVFLLASTSEVYGDPEVNPQPESYWGHVNSVGPRSMYDESKRFAEAFTVAYRLAHGVDARIVRIFNTYGPRLKLDDGRALSTFIDQALHDRPLTVYGKGAQTRSFCYVDDLVEGIFRLVSLPPPADMKGEPLIVNLGNPDEVTILELAWEVIEVLGARSEVVHESLPRDDPQKRKPDITRARQLLDWAPQVSRAEGIRRLADYYREAAETAEGGPRG